MNIITNNTKENRAKLEKLGFSPLRFFQGKEFLYAKSSNRANIHSTWTEYYYSTSDEIEYNPENYINNSVGFFDRVSEMMNNETV